MKSRFCLVMSHYSAGELKRATFSSINVDMYNDDLVKTKVTTPKGLPNFSEDSQIGMRNREKVLVVITTMTGSFLVFAIIIFFVKLRRKASADEIYQLPDVEMNKLRIGQKF